VTGGATASAAEGVGTLDTVAMAALERGFLSGVSFLPSSLEHLIICIGCLKFMGFLWAACSPKSIFYL
jgi:hypothetical protein